MEIILLEKIQNVGDIGDLVNVRNGYARNFLIPQKKAVRATAEAKAEVALKRKQLAESEAGRLEDAKARAEQAVREVSLTRLCGEQGRLYGSVSPADIAEAMNEAGSSIEKSEINQPDGPIKHTGDYEASVTLHPEVSFTVVIHVGGEQTGGTDRPADAQEGGEQGEQSEPRQTAAESPSAEDAPGQPPGGPSQP